MRVLRLLAKRGNAIRYPANGYQRGYTLVEVVVAVAIVGVIAVAFLSALTSGYLALALADENTVAESLTRTEFERIREAAYPIVLVDAGPNPAHGEFLRHRPVLNGMYAVDIEVAPEVDPTAEERPIQLVTVVISHQGEIVLTTETYTADATRSLLSQPGDG
jgi:prepilin-type N-terminal cleavage/methylation domain-containing protein